MRVLAISLFVLSLGCGGSDSKIYTEFDDSGAEEGADTATSEDDAAAGGDAATESDAGGEASPGADTASGSETSPGGDTGSGGDTGAGGDGAPKVACDGPEDCTTGVCCGDVTMAAMCKPTVNTSECRSSCLNFGPTPCPGTSKLRLCHAKADCTQPNFGKCCLFENAGKSTELCVNDGMVSFAKSCK